MTSAFRCLSVAAAALIATVLGGCRNTLTASVERVDIAAANVINPRSRIGGRLFDSAHRLNQAESRLREYDDVLKKVIASRTSDAVAFASALTPTRDAVKAAADVAKTLSEALRKDLSTKSVDPLALDARADLLRVESFWNHEYAVAASFIERLDKNPKIGEAVDAADVDMTKAFDAAKTFIVGDQSAKPAASLGFGGFCSTDVYLLNPSDPVYQKVLAATPVKVSSDPLTLASADAAGESSIMVVFEQPTQARIFQVSADPSQIARNIGIITSKMSSAALRAVIGAGVP